LIKRISVLLVLCLTVFLLGGIALEKTRSIKKPKEIYVAYVGVGDKSGSSWANAMEYIEWENNVGFALPPGSSIYFSEK